MKNALSITLGILLLAAVGFAGTDSGKPVPAPGETVAPGVWAKVGEGQPDHERTRVAAPDTPAPLPFAKRTTRPLDAKQCKTATEAKSSGELDECTECWLDCQREWRRCRTQCGPDDFGSCVEACTDDLIWCQNVGCAPLCD